MAYVKAVIVVTGGSIEDAEQVAAAAKHQAEKIQKARSKEAGVRRLKTTTVTIFG